MVICQKGYLMIPGVLCLLRTKIKRFLLYTYYSELISFSSSLTADITISKSGTSP